MTLALIDVPRCLTVDASYVGSPRALAGSRRTGTAWAEAVTQNGTLGFREQAGRECLDMIATLRAYREPVDGEGWLVPAASERRLLAQVNAIIALGPQALKQVIALSLDADVPDSGRVFAGLLVLGCTEGRDWLEPAREIFIAATLRHPAEAAAAVEALSLCPNADIATLLSPLLDDERRRVRASAIRVLAYRGALAEGQWTSAMRESDPVLLAAALTAPLRGYDRIVCGRALEPVVAQSDAESLVRVALRAGLTIRLNAAHDWAEQIARNDPAWADAGECLAMFGDLDDLRHVREMLQRSRVEDGLRAAAVLGSIEAVPHLMALLDHDHSTPEVGVLTRRALTTITGLDFASAPDAAQALSLWSANSDRFDPGVRYRYGRPLTLAAMMESLRTGPGARKVRQDLYVEMLAATESRLPRFSAYDFVGVQAQSLRRIEHWLTDSRIQSQRAASLR
jgi:hypothetical protein